MNSTFLRENKTISADEPMAEKAPACAQCGAQMWLVRVEKKLSDDWEQSEFVYECKQCGASFTSTTSEEALKRR